MPPTTVPPNHLRAYYTGPLLRALPLLPPANPIGPQQSTDEIQATTGR